MVNGAAALLGLKQMGLMFVGLSRLSSLATQFYSSEIILLVIKAIALNGAESQIGGVFG